MQIVVLISGRGSNLAAIMDSLAPGQIKGVISDQRDAYGLIRAQKANIPTWVIAREDYSTKEEFHTQLLGKLEELNPHLICLAGYMRLLPAKVIQAFPMRIMNIHPSLLPAFPGLNGQKQALDYGVKITGCTVHFIDEGMDTGPIICQSSVQVHPTDDVDTLTKRILEQEHKTYVRAINLFAENRLVVKGRHVFIKEE